MRIQFIESPTGQPFMLSYSAGQFADLPDNIATALIEKKMAVEVEPGNRLTNAETSEKRAAIPSNNPTSKRTSTKSGGKKSS